MYVWEIFSWLYLPKSLVSWLLPPTTPYWWILNCQLVPFTLLEKKKTDREWLHVLHSPASEYIRIIISRIDILAENIKAFQKKLDFLLMRFCQSSRIQTSISIIYRNPCAINSTGILFVYAPHRYRTSPTISAKFRNCQDKSTLSSGALTDGVLFYKIIFEHNF